MFTLKTVAEIKAFQRKHKLVIDGIAGPQTRRVLVEVNRPLSQSARKEPNKSAIATSVVPAAAPSKPVKPAPLAITLRATSRAIDEIIVHCAATPEGKYFDVRDVTAWHKQRGWGRCGYHFIVLLDGTIQEGCPVGQEGIHTKRHNKGTIGISYIGGVSANGKMAKDTRTKSQRAALTGLVMALKAKHGITKRASGHNQYAQKACPSFSVPNDALGRI